MTCSKYLTLVWEAKLFSGGFMSSIYQEASEGLEFVADASSMSEHSICQYNRPELYRKAIILDLSNEQDKFEGNSHILEAEQIRYTAVVNESLPSINKSSNNDPNLFLILPPTTK